MTQTVRIRFFQFILDGKKYFFLALVIFVSFQFYWNFLGGSPPVNVRPTMETWTFYQKGVNSGVDEFSWINSKGRNDDADWKHLFNPEIFDYDIHPEISRNKKENVNASGVSNRSSIANTTVEMGPEKFAFSSDKEPLVPLKAGMTGLLIDETTNFATVGRFNVAIGSGLTTAKVLDLREDNLQEKMQLFKYFLPSFCKTVSIKPNGESRYNFHFYFAYDFTDKVLDGLVRNGGFYRVFRQVVGTSCPSGLPAYLHFVQCDHTHRPAWAQNDAMVEAYLDNVDYFYRINDDTVMKSPNWTDIFVDVLSNYNPQDVGVVGPSHSGGNMAILTYDFVHKTHVDIFGFYYPRLFTDWWGDDWVTKVYLPNRMTKVSNIFLQHTLALGQRYSVKDWGVAKKLQEELVRDKITLERYIRLVAKIKKDDIKPDPSRVIAMSLYSSKPRHVWGAVRNAQLARVLFPKWKLRFYVSRFSLNSTMKTTPNLDLHDHMINITSTKVSRRLLKRLRLLGAEIKLVDDDTMKQVKPINWRNLAIMDDNIEWLLVRNVDSRLTESESLGVEHWIDSFRRRLNVDSQSISLESIAQLFRSFVGMYSPGQGKLSAIHAIRDIPKSVLEPFPSGLWGGNARLLRLILDDSLHSIFGQKDHSSDEAKVDNATVVNSGISDVIQLKFKSLDISNPYLNPGIEELVRVWSRKSDEDDNKDQTASLRARLARLLMVEYLDHVTCNQKNDPRYEHSFAGQIFDEHEWPYFDNDVAKETVYESIDAVSPSNLCKTIKDLIAATTTESNVANKSFTTSAKTTTTKIQSPTSTTKKSDENATRSVTRM